MGASLAFDAALERFQRNDYILLNYHVHIPLPDPMTNPATLARQRFYGVSSTPTYYVDGDRDGGGAGAEQAKSLFDRKVDPVVTKRLETPPEATIRLRASRVGTTVKVKAEVSKVTSTSDRLRLQVALVEERVRYSGENGMRFHEMVVRSLAAVPPIPAVTPAAAASPAAGPAETKPAGAPKAADSKPADARPADTKPADAARPADAADTADAARPAAGTRTAVVSTGFPVKPGKGGSFQYTFDLLKVVADAKAHLDDYETNTRKGTYTFREKKHEIAAPLAVVAFVQDEGTKKILQAVYVKASSPKPTN